MRSGIYLITNTATGKAYVGSSTDLRARRNAHWSLLRRGRHPNIHLQRAWRRDGEATFQYAVLEHCAVADLCEREIWWLNLLRTRDPRRGYNIAHPDRREVSAATKAKLSAAHRGRTPWNKGRSLSPEHRARVSATLTGRTLSPEHVAASAAGHTGKPSPYRGKTHPPETRRKMSEAQRARWAKRRAARHE